MILDRTVLSPFTYRFLIQNLFETVVNVRNLHKIVKGKRPASDTYCLLHVTLQMTISPIIRQKRKESSKLLRKKNVHKIVQAGVASDNRDYYYGR